MATGTALKKEVMISVRTGGNNLSGLREVREMLDRIKSSAVSVHRTLDGLENRTAKAVSGISAALQSIQNTNVPIKADTVQAEGALKNLKKTAKEVSESISNVSPNVPVISTPVATYGKQSITRNAEDKSVTSAYYEAQDPNDKYIKRRYNATEAGRKNIEKDETFNRSNFEETPYATIDDNAARLRDAKKAQAQRDKEIQDGKVSENLRKHKQDLDERLLALQKEGYELIRRESVSNSGRKGRTSTDVSILKKGEQQYKLASSVNQGTGEVVRVGEVEKYDKNTQRTVTTTAKETPEEYAARIDREFNEWYQKELAKERALQQKNFDAQDAAEQTKHDAIRKQQLMWKKLLDDKDESERIAQEKALKTQPKILSQDQQERADARLRVKEAELANAQARLDQVKQNQPPMHSGGNVPAFVPPANVIPQITALQGTNEYYRQLMDQIRAKRALIKLEQEHYQMIARANPRANNDFISNFQHVSKWAASVSLLYGSLNLVQTSLSSVLKVGLQTARLEQVFTGIGGTTRQLRDDVLGLAAIYGRSTDEAMEAAVAWSRMGLTRVQVNEAVKVSLMAANVAEMTAAEATQHLSALMETYKLNVYELSTVLGQLNQISNIYAVTNNDMLTGLSRVAAVAKEAGLPLEELTGLMGAVIGSTRQSGANIGNSLKSMITGLGNTNIQEMLKGFNIEVKTGSGDELKSMSQILNELYLAYQKAGSVQKQWLLYTVAGKTQASRMAATMDSYVKSLLLAINAQYNLNSATEENKKIIATTQSRLTALNAEWQKFATLQSGMPMSWIGEVSNALKSSLQVLNAFPTATGAAIALFSAIGIKIMWVASTMQLAGAKMGFVAATIAHLRTALYALAAAANAAAASFSFTTALAGMSGTFKSMAAGFYNIMKVIATGSLAIGTVFAVIKTGALALWPIIAKIGSLAAVAITDILIPLAAVAAAIWGVSKLWTYSVDSLGYGSSKAKSKVEELNAELEKTKHTAKGYQLIGKYLSTAIEAEGSQSINDEEKKKWREGAAEFTDKINPDFTKRIKNAASSKEAIEIYKQALAEARKLENEENIKRAVTVRRNINIYDADIKRLRSKGASESGSGWKDNNLKEMIRLRTDAMEELNKQYDEIADSTNNEIRSTEANVALTERHKRIMEDIAKIYSAQEGADPITRALQEELSYKERIAEVEAEIARNTQLSIDIKQQDAVEEKRRADAVAKAAKISSEIESYERKGKDKYSYKIRQLKEEYSVAAAEASRKPVNRETSFKESQEIGDQLRKELEKLKGERKASAAQGLESRAWTGERIKYVREFSNASSNASAIGSDDTGKLINQQNYLRQAIRKNAIDLAKNPSNSDAIIAMQNNKLNLISTENKLRTRGVEIEAEYKQLLIDQNKEFRKSLNMAGPEEMLRKMSAMNLANRRGGINAGQWFAMSTGMRQEVAQYDARYSADGQSKVREYADWKGKTGYSNGQQALSPQDATARQIIIGYYGVSDAANQMRDSLIRASANIESWSRNLPSPGQQGQSPVSSAPAASKPSQFPAR